MADLISVCVATFNGANYLREQLDSILVSPLVGEVIVSDDGSSDRTLEILAGFDDPRLISIKGPGMGLIRNFGALLERASGEIIFLSDQDDVWLPDKVAVMAKQLKSFDLVVSDCMVVDVNLRVLQPSFFAMRDSRSGLVRNLWKNRYLGCCMAFRRDLLRHALPFPPHLPMHDWWLGLVAEVFGKVAFIDQTLTLYRRHGGNASQATEVSIVPWSIRIRWRLQLLFALIARKITSLCS